MCGSQMEKAKTRSSSECKMKYIITKSVKNILNSLLG